MDIAMLLPTTDYRPFTLSFVPLWQVGVKHCTLRTAARRRLAFSDPDEGFVCGILRGLTGFTESG